MRERLLRVIDANFNRAREGLRVCEDVCRFFYDHKSLTAKYKLLRHELTRAVCSLKMADVIEARQIENDVGRGSTRLELKRKDVNDIFYANSQRAKESTRVLEEFAKLIDPTIAQKIKGVRYKIYALEKKTAQEF